MRITHALTIGAIALALLAAIGSVALADATITSNVSINSTGGPGGARQQTSTVTVSYQGDNLRMVSGNGSVMIYTGGKLYRVNAANQTYCLMPTPPKPPGNPPANSNDTFSLAATGQTGNVAGQAATQYAVSATGPAGPPPGMRPPGGGWSGSSSGNNFSGPPSGQSGGPPPIASMSGQIWLSDTVKIDSGAKDALTIALGRSLGLRGPIAQPLAARLLAMGDAPLSANITITMSAMPDGTQPTTTVQSTVTSVGTASLDSSLFAIPTGYTQVQDPQGGPGRGGPGGGGPGGPPPPND